MARLGYTFILSIRTPDAAQNVVASPDRIDTPGNAFRMRIGVNLCAIGGFHGFALAAGFAVRDGCLNGRTGGHLKVCSLNHANSDKERTTVTQRDFVSVLHPRLEVLLHGESCFLLRCEASRH